MTMPKRGRLTVTHNGRIGYETARAKELLTEYFGAPKPTSSVPEKLLRWLKSRERLAPERASSTPMLLSVAQPKKRLLVWLLSNLERHSLLLEEVKRGAHHARKPPDSAEFMGLSRRELDVLSWVAEGKTNAEIGFLLGLSPRTVQKHLEHIFQKLGVETRTAAAKRFLSSNLHPESSRR